MRLFVWVETTIAKDYNEYFIFQSPSGTRKWLEAKGWNDLTMARRIFQRMGYCTCLVKK